MKVDVLILGGGHAGLEAACIAQQFHLSVGLLSMPGVPLGSAPCNPAIGGVGKGQVVREIDALGGVMGKFADLGAIQYRVLNESKGYAVRSTRAQIDKELYARVAETYLESLENFTVIRDKAVHIEKNSEFIVTLASGAQVICSQLIVTTGTFLAGKMHTGPSQTLGGRVGCDLSPGLSDLFQGVQKLSQRFKTGTPPRLDKNSINYSELEEQPSDPEARNFHILHDPFERHVEQVSCFLTRTTEKTLSYIRENKEKSPLFNGQIKGIGPRYCPSIEDKAFRYVDRNTHHVFIEPEGLNLDTVYPNGLSTSLPVEIQEEFLRTIPGLENCEIKVPGYAVEYDVVDTTRLKETLEHKDIPGLFFAGQVNGTSGYEEAAGQGLVAGINAALNFLGRDAFVLSRQDSYIGVMVHDLVTNLRDEPYRLFTARSEDRLYLREDNTLIRMFPYRQSLGLKLPLDDYYMRFLREQNILEQLCEITHFKPSSENSEYFESRSYGELPHNGLSLEELLRKSQLDPVAVLKRETLRLGGVFSMDVVATTAIGVKYKGYIQKANTANSKLRKLDPMKLKWEILVESPNISFECKLRIKTIRPENFGQLRNIEGIRPATLAVVAGQFS